MYRCIIFSVRVFGRVRSRLLEAARAAERMASATSITLHFEDESEGGKARKHTIKMNVPASWATKPCSKIFKYYAKSFNATHTDKPIDADKLRLFCDRDRSFIDAKWTVDAAVQDGQTYTFSEAKPSEADEKVLYTAGLTAKPEPPKPPSYPRRMKVIGKGLLLRAGAELTSDKLAQFPFESVVMVHERVELEDGTVRMRCGADAAIPEDAKDTIVFDTEGRWPCEGWGSGKVLAELVHPRKPGVPQSPAHPWNIDKDGNWDGKVPEPTWGF